MTKENITKYLQRNQPTKTDDNCFCSFMMSGENDYKIYYCYTTISIPTAKIGIQINKLLMIVTLYS